MAFDSQSTTVLIPWKQSRRQEFAPAYAQLHACNVPNNNRTLPARLYIGLCRLRVAAAAAEIRPR